MYNADRELATTTVLRECSSGSAWSVAVATTLTADPLLRTELLLATMLASWCDRYADVFLSIGGARLSVRLQRQVFNLIMEQVRRSMHQGCLLNPRNLVFYPFFPIFRPFSASGRQESREHGQKSRGKRERFGKIVENRGN